MPMRIGIPMKKTMVVPCIVSSPLKVSGPINVLPAGQNSCKRINTASQPR